MTRKDLVRIAIVLHKLEDQIGGDWYEVVNTFVGEFSNEWAPTLDANEFRRICAGGTP
jgi:hypothetical protein